MSSWLEGHTARAYHLFARIAAAHPADLFAAKRAQLLAFLLGSPRLMLSVVADPAVSAACAPHNNRNHNNLSHGHSSAAPAAPVVARPYYHGMLAFALEQAGRLSAALAAGLAGARLSPADPWAHHGAAHALYYLARLRPGLRFMLRRAPLWGRSMSFMLTHNWFHIALFQLDLDAFSDVVAVWDRAVWPWQEAAADAEALTEAAESMSESGATKLTDNDNNKDVSTTSPVSHDSAALNSQALSLSQPQSQGSGLVELDRSPHSPLPHEAPAAGPHSSAGAGAAGDAKSTASAAAAASGSAARRLGPWDCESLLWVLSALKDRRKRAARSNGNGNASNDSQQQQSSSASSNSAFECPMRELLWFDRASAANDPSVTPSGSSSSGSGTSGSDAGSAGAAPAPLPLPHALLQDALPAGAALPSLPPPFPLQDPNSSQDQLGAAGLLWKLEMRLNTRAATVAASAAAAAAAAAASAAAAGAQSQSRTQAQSLSQSRSLACAVGFPPSLAWMDQVLPPRALLALRAAFPTPFPCASNNNTSSSGSSSSSTGSTDADSGLNVSAGASSVYISDAAYLRALSAVVPYCDTVPLLNARFRSVFKYLKHRSPSHADPFYDIMAAYVLARVERAAKDEAVAAAVIAHSPYLHCNSGSGDCTNNDTNVTVNAESGGADAQIDSEINPAASVSALFIALGINPSNSSPSASASSISAA